MVTAISSTIYHNMSDSCIVSKGPAAATVENDIFEGIGEYDL